jgi:hypothetical protein
VDRLWTVQEKQFWRWFPKAFDLVFP